MPTSNRRRSDRGAGAREPVEVAPSHAGADADEPGLDRIWTVPNFLSLSRIGMLGVFWWLLAGPGDRVAATVVLGVAGVTDFLDGYVARHLHQVTTLGKIVDPVADRVVVGGAMVAILVTHTVVWWLGVIVLAREAIMSIAVVTLALARAARIDVIWLGKAGTFGLMFALPAFVLGSVAGHAHRAAWQTGFTVFAWCAVTPALVLAWAATCVYVPRARAALVAGRRAAPGDAEPGGEMSGDGAV